MKMNMYKCLDDDCNKIVPESNRLSIINCSGIEIFKCPFCRGRLILLSEEEYQEFINNIKEFGDEEIGF